MTHSTRVGSVVQIHAPPSGIHSKVRVLRERGGEREGRKAMQNERGSGGGVVGRREAVTADESDADEVEARGKVCMDK